MSNKIIYSVIIITICIILTGSLMLPIINDAVDDNYKVRVNNSSSYYRSAIDNDTLEINGSQDGIIIDGESYTMAGTLTQILITSDFVIYANQAGRIVISYYDGTEGNEFDNVSSFDVTLINKVINASFTDADAINHEISNLYVDWAFVYSDDTQSDWVFVVASNNPTINVNDLDQIYTVGYNATSGMFFSINGKNVLFNDVPVGSIKYNERSINGYTDYVSLTISSTNPMVSLTTDDNPIEFRPYYFVVPSEILVTPSDNISVINLFYAVPVIFLAALVALAAGLVLRRY